MPRSHYETLKIARDAPIEVIRAAYRALSQKYHPDRDPANPEAAQSMALLNSAYEVLSDPEKRRQHDAWIRSMESVAFQQQALWSAELAHKWARESLDDSLNTRAFAHLRRYGALYAIALVVFLVWGVSSALHHWKEFAQPTATLSDIFQDPTSRSPDTTQSSEPSPPAASSPATANSTSIPGPAASSLSGDKSPPRRKNSSPSAGDKSTSLPPPAHDLSRPGLERGSSSSAARASKPQTQTAAEPSTASASTRKSDSYTRPSAAPSGEPWPASSDYVAGYEQLNLDGLSQVVIDNRHNNFDALVKVVSLSESEPTTVRALFISANDRFTVSELRAGTYEIRYQNLDSGALLKSGLFALDESAIGAGTRYSTVTLRLQQMPDDSRNTYALSEQEF